MTDKQEPRYLDSGRLKQVNLELGHLASKHRACRLNSGLFSTMGAVILAVSVLGLFQLIPAGADDWAQNPDSPVYALAAREEQQFKVKAVMVTVGFATGLALLYFARRQCARQRGLWQREGDLRTEMRALRDRLYAVDLLLADHGTHPKRPERHVGQLAPLEPGDARCEYVGVYNPPAGEREQAPGSTKGES